MKRLLLAAALCCASVAHAGLISGFNGPFAVSNWTSSPDSGSISTLGAPDAVSLTSGDNGPGTFAFTSFYLQFNTNATVSFNWNYASTDDPFFESFGFVLADDPLDLLAGFGQLTNDAGGPAQSGTQSVVVAAGQYFGFAVQSLDNQPGPATTTVNALRFDVPEPGSLALLAVALAAAATTKRRRAA